MVAFAVKEFCGFGGLDGGPDAACLSGGKKIGEELTLGFRVTEDDLAEVAQESDPVGGIERGGGDDEPFQLKVGEEGIDDEGADVVRSRKLIAGYVEMLPAIEDLIEYPPRPRT